MQLALVAFPEIAAADLAWIEALRREADAQATRIGAHLTFVFPTDRVSSARLGDHVASVVGGVAPIALRLDRWRIASHGAHYIFLEPTLGAEACGALYDRLHAGPLADLRRPDMPFAPHVTVGRFSEAQPANDLLARIAGRRPSVTARIDALALVEVPPDGPVRALRGFALAG